jgi:Aldehyde dehydrogenase family
MRSSRGRPSKEGPPLGLRLGAAAGLAFLHLPLAFIILYAFSNEDRSFEFPPPGYTLRWFGVAWNRPDIWAALGLSIRVALVSTALAIVLGTLAAAALARARFFGREAISLLFVLPIALPGIVTGIALRSAFNLADTPSRSGQSSLATRRFASSSSTTTPSRVSKIVAVHDRSLHGPKRRRVPDRAPYSPARDWHCFACRGHALLCSVLRRSDRHHVHGGPAADPADLDAVGADPTASAAGHKCRRGRGHRAYRLAHTSMVRRDPIGVVGSIAPWNYPLMMAAWKLAPALAGGNTVVLKPSEQTPLTALKLARLVAEIFPAGVVNVVVGRGETVGNAIINHPKVAMVSLTGDIATGKKVLAAAAKTVKRTHLELGGKNAQITSPPQVTMQRERKML